MDRSQELGDAIERCLAFDAADVREGKLDPGVDAPHAAGCWQPSRPRRSSRARWSPIESMST
jgi:hypothetical protein